jgi:hypothetical protein
MACKAANDATLNGRSRGAGSLTGWPGCRTVPLFIFQIFSMDSKLNWSIGGLLLPQNFNIKYILVDNHMRNKLPSRSFSKFKSEFELKFTEPD